MDVFLALFVNLLPLYVLIGIGYGAGRYFGVDRVSLANLAVFIFMPFVAFGYVAQLDLKPSYLLLPVFFFAVSALIGLPFLKIGQKIYGDSRGNLMAMCASMGNTGYFGLPIIFMLFDERVVAIYIFAMMGGSIYESTIGYFMAARGNFDTRQALIKVAKFPTLYAILAGLLFNSSGGVLPDMFIKYWEYFRGAYVVVGMMIIGIALCGLKHMVIGWRFMGGMAIGKLIAFPALFALGIWADKEIFGLFDEDIHKAILMLSIVPPAANIVVFATQMNMQPEKAATTILISTVAALFYIPLVLTLLGY